MLYSGFLRETTGTFKIYSVGLQEESDKNLYSDLGHGGKVIKEQF